MYSCLVIAIFLFSCEKNQALPEVPLDSFWEVATPSSQQMDEAIISEAASLVNGLDDVYSFLIVRNGKIVHEQYRNGAKRNSLLHTRSITKRITATLVGSAIDEEYIESLHVPVATYFPEVSNPGTGQGWDYVTIPHLLNMVSGMDWSEEKDLSAYENNLHDPITFIFETNIIDQPGTYYAYNSPGIHLLSYAIERTSGDPIADFADRRLFEPLGILGYEWEADGNGVKRGGAGLQLTARDLAKIGLLYLEAGKWEGKQIVSEQWVDQCFRETISLDLVGGDHQPGLSIGHTWWAQEVQGTRIHYGDGYGGQILLLIPDQDIVIVMNRHHRVEVRENYAAFQFFFNQILPKVMESIIAYILKNNYL